MTRPSLPVPAMALAATLAAVLVSLAPPALARPVHSVGHVTWHPKRYVGRMVEMRGYLLRHEKGYILFSDEAGGRVSAHDLPVTGPWIGQVAARRRYVLTGRFVQGGLQASNRNPYHLVLTRPPQPATK